MVEGPYLGSGNGLEMVPGLLRTMTVVICNA
jgi:hypothetical protein